MTASTDQELTGRTLGDFVVRHRLGEGGFGAVYRADQPALGREAVIKVLHARHRSSKTVIQRFLREARLASKLDHPYAAHIYAFGVETDGLMWIAMEFVRGQSLYDLLRARTTIPIEELVPLLERICEVLQAAHDLGIVHRDIKPPNVMVVQRSGSTFPKLLDFGIAKLTDATRAGDPQSDPVIELPPASGAATPTPTPHQASTLRGGPTPQPETVASVAQPATAAGSDRTISFVGIAGGALAAALAPPNAPAPAPPVKPRAPTVPDGHAAHAATADLGGAASAPGDKPYDPILTEAGAAVGSPPYMPPEQWEDSTTTSPRSDLYSLGVMAYECLCGYRPFVASSLTAMAIAHASAPVPPLPTGMPVALHAVLAKALAKDPGDRYGSAMEFASAFRTAAGLGAKEQLPVLDHELRASVEASFPQPLAEAVAAFAAARNAHQGRDALRDIRTTAIRYAAVVALAAVAQTPPSDPGERATLAEQVRELRRRQFSDEDWLALARTLTRPFAANAKAHAVPELVQLLHAGADRDPFSAVFEATPTGGAGGDASSDLRAMLPEITRLLRALTFLADYPLVVATADRAESWMGIRRPRRVAIETQAKGLVAGQPMLLDRAGKSLVALWPLVQVASPLPEVAPELFLLDGRGRRGARLVALPQTLERQDEKVWDWLGEHVADEHQAESRVESDSADARPYRGLASFTTEDAESFVGRERELDAAVNRLKVSAFVVVVGPSGAGKSSFVHAGIVPSLPPDWLAISTRPGATPLATLEARLARAGVAAEGLATALVEDPNRLGALLLAHARPVALVIDQFEELFTLGATTAEQRTYARALLAVAQHDHTERACVIVTLRDDFLARAVQLPELRDRLTSSLFMLGTPARAELVRILTEPLARRGFDFDDPSLPGRMVDEVAETPGALPLLSFTAQQLWERRDRRFRQLTTRAYEALGGVAGALGQHAETTFTAMSHHEQQLARLAFGHLVTSEGTRAVLSRTELDQLLADPQSGAVIEKLIAARLLTATERAGADDGIELVHEALLSAWPRLETWRREDSEGAHLRDQIRAAARQWQERGRPRGLLWRDDALAELKAWRARHAQPMTATDDAFIAASIREGRRNKRLRNGIVILVLALMTVAVAVSLVARQAARATAAREHDRYLEEVVERARKAVLDNHSAEAARAVADAVELGVPPSPSFSLIEATARQAENALLATLPGHTGSIVYTEFDKSGTRLVTAGEDGVVRIWDVATKQALVTIADCKGKLYGARFDAAKDKFSTDCTDGMIRVYRADGVRLWQLQAAPTVATAYFNSEFTPDGNRLVTVGGEATKAWDLSTGAMLWAAKAPYSQESLAVNADATLAATVELEGDGRIDLWSMADGSLVRSFSTGYTVALQFARTGGTLLTANADRTLRVWDIATGKVARELTGHSGWVEAARFSPDGTLIASASRDRTVRLWKVDTGELVISFSTGEGYGTSIVFDDKGRLAVGTTEGVAFVWDTTSLVQVARFEGMRGVRLRTVAFSPDGAQIATGGDDAIARLWSASGSLIKNVLHHGEQLRSAQAHDGGRRMYTVASDGSVSDWELPAGRFLAKVKAEAPLQQNTSTVVLPDDSIVWGDGAGGVYRWDGKGARQAFAHHDAGVTALAASPDGKLVISGDNNGGVLATPVAGGAPIKLAGHDNNVLAIAVSPDNQTIATGDGHGQVMLWRPDGKRIATLVGHTDMVTCLQFTPDGRLFSAGADPTARLWSPTGTLVQKFVGHSNIIMSVHFDAATRHAVTTSVDGTARTWDLATGKELLKLQHDGPVRDAMFYRDDAFVITVGALPLVRVWDATSGRELLDLEGHTDFVWGVSPGPRPGQFTTPSFDGNAIVWQLP